MAKEELLVTAYFDVNERRSSDREYVMDTLEDFSDYFIEEIKALIELLKNDPQRLWETIEEYGYAETANQTVDEIVDKFESGDAAYAELDSQIEEWSNQIPGPYLILTFDENKNMNSFEIDDKNIGLFNITKNYDIDIDDIVVMSGYNNRMEINLSIYQQKEINILTKPLKDYIGRKLRTSKVRRLALSNKLELQYWNVYPRHFSKQELSEVLHCLVSKEAIEFNTEWIDWSISRI